ncbi:MAG TPA: 3-hydroxyacyl-ACP dehydratase FabZ [Nitrospirota bacterium]|nr:3-hydroxyacyl-ACP dehydratase FabZ [Nitrospirota bacterium]
MQLNFEEIKKLIPQRFPFIMVDKVLEIEPGKHVIAVKNISGNDMVFIGHFPEKAIMPGALILEAMAQTAIILFASNRTSENGDRGPLYYFGSVKARFLHPAVPGDQLMIKVVNVKSLPTGAYVSGEAFVGDRKITEADLVFSTHNE